mmetsp:Transcript_42874/g.130419  ORF Transcript_42874/g.130419 Transcript_42874/m.130419 type:complete len:611 (+) Transcript_42874:1500-3332(+)
MPLLCLLESLEPCVVIQSLLLGNALEHILNTRHHTLEPTEVDVRPGLELPEHLVSVLLDLVLDVHLAPLGVGLLPRQSVVDAEVVRELLLGLLELVIVKEGIAVGDAEEEPRLAFVDLSGGGVLNEEAADKSTVRGDSGAGGDHDIIGGGVLLGHEHDLTRGARHLDLISGLGVAEEVGADALLGRIVGLELGAPVGGAADAEGASVAGHVVAVAGGGDGVQADSMGLAILLAVARGDDPPGLALPVGEVALVIDNDVARLAGRLGSNDALGRDDLAREWSLVLVHVNRDGGLIPVRLGLKEVLLLLPRRQELPAGNQGQYREGRDAPLLPREGDGRHDNSGRHDSRENRRQGHGRRHPQEERAHRPGPRTRSREGDAHERRQRRPLLLERTDSEARRLLLRALEDGGHELLELLVPQQEHQRNDGNHIPHDARGQHGGDGESHPKSDGDGPPQLDHRHGRDDRQDGHVGQAEGAEIVRDLLSDVQVLPGGLDGRGQGRRGGRGRRERDDRQGERRPRQDLQCELRLGTLFLRRGGGRGRPFHLQRSGPIVAALRSKDVERNARPGRHAITLKPDAGGGARMECMSGVEGRRRQCGDGGNKKAPHGQGSV